jgi:hypothetical protein
MDKKEFATFAMALKTYYPRETLLPNTQAMELWYKQLQGIPLVVAQIALEKWVATNKWSPSISDLFNVVEKIHWEAYETVSSPSFNDIISAEYRKRLEWIYEVTKPYKMAKLAEPSIISFFGREQTAGLEGQQPKIGIEGGT